MKIGLFTVLLMTYASAADGFSSGAPEAACAAVSPSPASPPNGHGALPQTTQPPYNVSGLPLEYTPGAAYTLEFAGMNQNFRGVLIVSESSPGFRLGTFRNSAGTRRVCSNSGLTHVDRGIKLRLTFTWIAPNTGSGPITFRFAVVQIRTIYWAAQVAGVVQERALPPPSFVLTSITPSIIPTSVVRTAVVSSNLFTSTSFSPTPRPTPAFNCTGVYCSRYQRLNPYTCACECPNYCNASLQLNPYTCQCECPYLRSEALWRYRARDCARFSYGSSFNPVTCGCECVQLYDCSFNQYFDRSSCSCRCNNYYSCSEGMFFNTNSCRCECSERYCPPGFSMDPYSCECYCNMSCGYDEILDNTTCQCRRKSQYPDVQCPSLQSLYTCLNAESLFGISCQWQNGACGTECCSPKPSRSPHFGYKLCPQLDSYRCSQSEYCNYIC